MFFRVCFLALVIRFFFGIFLYLSIAFKFYKCMQFFFVRWTVRKTDCVKKNSSRTAFFVWCCLANLGHRSARWYERKSKVSFVLPHLHLHVMVLISI